MSVVYTNRLDEKPQACEDEGIVPDQAGWFPESKAAATWSSPRPSWC